MPAGKPRAQARFDKAAATQTYEKLDTPTCRFSPAHSKSPVIHPLCGSLPQWRYEMSYAYEFHGSGLIKKLSAGALGPGVAQMLPETFVKQQDRAPSNSPLTEENYLS